MGTRYKHLVLLVTLFLTCTPSLLRDAEVPVRVKINPGNPSPGQTVTITIDLSDAVAEDQTVAIAANSSYWSSIPSTIQILTGYDTGSFSATIRTSPTGPSAVIATCNGGSASAMIPDL